VRSLRGDGWQPGGAPGLAVMALAGHGGERCAFVRWQPGTRIVAQSRTGGEEIVVIDGVFSDQRGDHAAGTWLRSPRSIAGQAFSDKGCTVFVKTGHLPPVSDGGARRSVRSPR
jgi:anti-sigma factor ChrR (cupin superfamily)